MHPGVPLPFVRLLTARRRQVVMQVDGNVLDQLFKVLGQPWSRPETSAAWPGLIFKGLLRICGVEILDLSILNNSLGLAVDYLTSTPLFVVEMLGDGVTHVFYKVKVPLMVTLRAGILKPFAVECGIFKSQPEKI